MSRLRRSSNSGSVYSSDHGRMCPSCNRPVTACRCAENAAPPAGGEVRVGRQTKGRQGKQVTVITGVPLTGEAIRGLARELKARCGAGGTVKAGVIEIQGDHRDLLMAELQARGFRPRRTGG